MLVACGLIAHQSNQQGGIDRHYWVRDPVCLVGGSGGVLHDRSRHVNPAIHRHRPSKGREPHDHEEHIRR